MAASRDYCRWQPNRKRSVTVKQDSQQDKGCLLQPFISDINTFWWQWQNMVTVKFGKSRRLVPPLSTDRTPSLVVYRCCSPFLSEMSCHMRPQQLRYPAIFWCDCMSCTLQDLQEGIAVIGVECSCLNSLQYSAESAQRPKAQKLENCVLSCNNQCMCVLFFSCNNQYLSYELVTCHL